MTGFVYAEDPDEAKELACDDWNIHEESYDDSDSSGDSDYDYDDMAVTLEESDIDIQDIPARNNANRFTSAEPELPSYFLEEISELPLK